MAARSRWKTRREVGLCSECGYCARPRQLVASGPTVRRIRRSAAPVSLGRARRRLSTCLLARDSLCPGGTRAVCGRAGRCLQSLHSPAMTPWPRMKFICDSERCIECNSCVTACKSEHEIPWGVDRRRVVALNDGVPGERSISVACMHCSDATCMAACPGYCFYRTEEGVVLHDKGDGQVHSLRGRPRDQRRWVGDAWAREHHAYWYEDSVWRS